ncbi:MAG: hypothetical protein ABIG11_10885, partial [bacterium]
PKEGKIEITKIDGRTKEEVPIKDVSKLINDRLGDIFENINAHIGAFNINPELIASCVITGGGAKLPGIAEYVHDKIGVVTRLGYAQNCRGDDALVNDLSYTSALGLLKYDFRKEAPTLGGRKGRRRKGLFELLGKIF